MANKKNKNNKAKSTHRHVFNKKKLSPWLIKKKKPPMPTKLEGSRIINLDELSKYTEELNAHSSRCQGAVRLIGECRNGLASILRGHCEVCEHTIRLETSKKVKGPRGYRRWESNLAAVWGQMTTGQGHSQLEESMSTMGVPVMTKAAFISTEKDIGACWKAELQQSMAEASREERRLAEERGSFHEGVPAITVIVDGGWSKRSHKHSYNAKSGVAIIIGKETGKLLHIGVRNKYCHACTRGIPLENHDCYKNWNSSSSEMETSIIVEGFLQAEKVHGVRYVQFIGDGDSSVYPSLMQNVPGWGYAIKKLECANHACKCYRGALEQLIQSNPSYKGNGGLTQKIRKKLVSAARCAIRMRSREVDGGKALSLIREDLVNGPLHVFGVHTRCSTDFCTVRQQQQSEQSPLEARNTDPSDDEENCDQTGDDGSESGHHGGEEDDDADIDGVLSESEAQWRETAADDPATESDARQGGLTPTKGNEKLLYDIQAVLSRLVAKASQLLGNNTTNLAECCMHVRTKFDGGKVINRSQSGSFGYRSMGAGLRQNLGANWGPQVWKNVTTTSPNKVFSDTAVNSAKRAKKDRERKRAEEAKESRRRSKYAPTESTTAARSSYSRHDDGITPEELNDDVTPEHLEELKDGFYRTKVVVTADEAKAIEISTRDQADNMQWLVERRKRLSASKVGSIGKMRKITNRRNKIKELLYSTFKGNKATQYGCMKEEETIQQYITHQRCNGHPDIYVDKCGLHVSVTNPWIGASPDGIVRNPDNRSHGLVEIKNPYSMKDKTLAEACQSTTFCLEKKNSMFRLKTKYNYYYQVQCQLYCTDTEWCDFVLRTDKEIHIQRIHRDRKWWGVQLAKLRQFYFAALLPELACPRHRSGGIREPTVS